MGAVLGAVRNTQIRLPENPFGKVRMLVDGAMEGAAFDVSADVAELILSKTADLQERGLVLSRPSTLPPEDNPYSRDNSRGGGFRGGRGGSRGGGFRGGDRRGGGGGGGWDEGRGGRGGGRGGGSWGERSSRGGGGGGSWGERGGRGGGGGGWGERSGGWGRR